MCVWGLTEDLEARALKGKPRATHQERKRVPARRATGLAETAGAGRRVSSETVPTDNRGVIFI